jgi:hypothetical protein
LTLAVLEDLKILGAEISDDLSILVCDGDVDLDEIRGDLYDG